MGLRTTLASLLSAPVAALLESRIRHLADAAIDARDLATPATVRDLSVQVERTRAAVEGLQRDVASCRAALGALPEDDTSDDLALRIAGLCAQDEELAARVDTLVARLSEMGDQVVTLRGALEARPTSEPSRTSKPEPTEPEPMAAEERGFSADAAPRAAPETKAHAAERRCRVPGCTGTHRARGLCGRHYQMHKRGTLPDFVNADGTLFFEGDDARWQVDPELAGEPAERTARTIRVNGKRVPAQRLS